LKWGSPRWPRLSLDPDIDETTVHILDSVLSILKVDRASLMLWNSQGKHLQTQWVRGTDFRIHSAMTLAMGEGMAGWALQLGSRIGRNTR